MSKKAWDERTMDQMMLNMIALKLDDQSQGKRAEPETPRKWPDQMRCRKSFRAFHHAMELGWGIWPSMVNGQYHKHPGSSARKTISPFNRSSPAKKNKTIACHLLQRALASPQRLSRPSRPILMLLAMAFRRTWPVQSIQISTTGE